MATIGAIYVMVALSFLFQYAAAQKNPSKRKSTYILVFVALIPLLIEMIYIIDVTFISHTLRLRFYPGFSLSLTSFFMVYILLKYRFLDLIPVAQKDIVNNLSEAVIVVDDEGKVISVNKSFQKTFPVYQKTKTA